MKQLIEFLTTWSGLLQTEFNEKRVIYSVNTTNMIFLKKQIKALDDAVEALNELQDYRNIGADANTLNAMWLARGVNTNVFIEKTAGIISKLDELLMKGESENDGSDN